MSDTDLSCKRHALALIACIHLGLSLSYIFSLCPFQCFSGLHLLSFICFLILSLCTFCNSFFKIFPVARIFFSHPHLLFSAFNLPLFVALHHNSAHLTQGDIWRAAPLLHTERKRQQHTWLRVECTQLKYLSSNRLHDCSSSKAQR